MQGKDVQKKFEATKQWEREKARELDKEQEKWDQFKKIKKYDIHQPDYDSYEQSDYDLEEEDIYPKKKDRKS